MPLKLLFFGVLTDATGTSELAHDLVTDTEALKQAVSAKFPEVATYTYNLAVNQEITHEAKALNDGDEIAFMPPYSGG